MCIKHLLFFCFYITASITVHKEKVKNIYSLLFRVVLYSEQSSSFLLAQLYSMSPTLKSLHDTLVAH